MNRILLLSMALALAACGKASTALERNRGGSGSGTLFVNAGIEQSSSTSFDLDLKDGAGVVVSGATVVVHNDPFGNVTLAEQVGTPGHYRASMSAMSAGDFGLDVSHPSKGSVTGVVVGNPGMHTINAPMAGVAVPTGQPLQISWTTPATAYSASIATKNFGPVQAPDTGTYTIPGTSNPIENAQRLDVKRENVVNISGGTIGSQLSLTSKVSVTFPVQ
ncbi:MAG TPA: hypothetical protein VII08_07460 [Myxococcales bacterium]